MALHQATAGSAVRMADDVRARTPALLLGPPPPSPVPPTPGMYMYLLPGPPPPGVLLLPRPIYVPLSLEVLARRDEFLSRALLKFISDAGVVPSAEDEQRRQRVLCELGMIVMDWVKRVAHEQGQRHLSTTATVLSFGSYDLGAHGPESDIDVVCVGPHIASRQHHFFVVLRHMLEGRQEVSDLHLIEGAKVPLMRFKFSGILVDFSYIRLPMLNASKVIYELNRCVLKNDVDEASWKCLSGLNVNRQIIGLVPNMKKFQYLLRCLKLWARKRGVQCHVLGFFAGVHLAILAAYVCRRHPNASINTLLSLFFHTFVHWPWPLPVSLRDLPALGEHPDGCSCLMPIMIPSIPKDYCSSSMTGSTFSKIKEELQRGYALTKDTITTDFDWSWLFAPFPYGTRYKCFLRIVLSAPTAEELRDWVGWVKSRFRNLVVELENLGVYCDPDPSEQADHTITEPNVVFLWGLIYTRDVQVCASSLKEGFMRSIFNNIYGKEKCTSSDISMTIVGPPELPNGSVSDHSVCSEKIPPNNMGPPELVKKNYAVS